ncbi:MAG: hypothetical protein QOD50_1885, partial [Actinomycetota bacterium]|nr:hypothetical protein [Actinomycetota bacterium]
APYGLEGFRLFLSLAIPAPIIGWSQSRVLRRWSRYTRLWVLASTVGWGGLFAVEVFRNDALGGVISSPAGSSVELPGMLSIVQLARPYWVALSLEQLLESH